MGGAPSVDIASGADSIVPGMDCRWISQLAAAKWRGQLIVLAWSACGLVVLIALLVVFRARKAVVDGPDSIERASRPEALLDAELLYVEKMFRISNPVGLSAKLDRAYRTPSGAIVLVEFKTHSINRPLLSDVVQLSAQRLALKGQMGQEVAPYGYVVIKTPSKSTRHIAHRVELMLESHVVDLVRRREDILTGRVVPRYADSQKMCRTCAFRSQCDNPHLALNASLPSYGS
jgi:CRISPR/Cas system-associated exonuclease Cas4 (RecB family)